MKLDEEFCCRLPHLWSIIDYMKREKKATRREIIDHLRAEGFNYSDPAVDKHIRLLCDLGYLERVGRGVYRIVE
jgi:repressor of nif and glnA expression